MRGEFMVRVKLKEITKRFGKVVAADHVTLNINHGEFFTILGPSGCGKTTTLRIIAGFEKPDYGRVYFNDQDITELPAYKRDTGMVFQNYALWPHMTVFENIAYGLKIRKIPKDEIKRRVKEVLELVKLEGLENRYPHQLSGGQQQRVALARALVIQPKVLLLDEPLSNLDAKLRVEMREELRILQKKLGITTIYVTHDQEEAMVLSDRLAIMNYGKIYQVGSPKEVYMKPRNLFVATFIGKSSVLNGIIEKIEGEKVIVKCNKTRITGHLPSEDIKVKIGSKVACILRPEYFEINEISEPSNIFHGVIEKASFVGSHIEIKVKINHEELTVYLDPEIKITIGEKIKLYMPHSRTIIVPI